MVRRPVITAAVCAVALAVPATAEAKTISIREHADLHLVRKSGSTIYQAGVAKGTIRGNISTRFEVGIASVGGSFTIFPRGGSLTIAVRGEPKTTGVRARFAGTMHVTGGTGRYRGASGTGTFSGVVNRRTWAATVDATARLTY